MPYDPSRERSKPRVNDPDPDVATFIMARVFADIYSDANARPLPQPLAAILRQMKCWRTKQE
jgi:hypothetical protein